MNKKPRTTAVSNGIAGDNLYGAVAPPLYLSTSFAFPEFGKTTGYDYSRAGNPSRDLLADTIAKLENGAGAVITSSGMAAIDLLLSQLSEKALVVAPRDCYAGTQRLLEARRSKGTLDVVFVDQNDDGAVEAALERHPALVFIETPSNPLMRIVDIRSLSSRAKQAGAMVAVDNTFLSPALQQPLLLGADFVVHSTTKYLNGHSDVVGGALICADPEQVTAMADWANTTGVTGSPFDSYLTLRGIRTLFARVEQQQRSAAAIADFLCTRPEVSRVYYPGLTDHPGYAIAATQQSGFGAMLSFDLRGGEAAVRRFVKAVEIFTLAESLGGIESLVAHPATMTHASMGAQRRHLVGIGDGLLRLSIGLEDETDLINGLSAGLNACKE